MSNLRASWWRAWPARDPRVTTSAPTWPDDALLRRIEDASLNASAPPQQFWLDGWLLRLSPGKARRARSINALAGGTRSVDDKLREAARRYHAAGLPMFIRITPYSQPAGLDQHLAGLGWHLIDKTLVMVLSMADPAETIAGPGAAPPPPAGIESVAADAADYAAAVGALRGSSAQQIAAHAQRLLQSPVLYTGLLWRRAGEVVACGQFAREGDLVGLYDIFTAPPARGAGLARQLCAALLATAHKQGASAAYLQVDGANAAAQAVYRRLGFVFGYHYHYRCADANAQ